MTGPTSQRSPHISIAEAPGHPEVLVPQRLEAAGLDPDYETVADPGLVAEIKRVCASCQCTQACEADFRSTDANVLVSDYCPNTPLIDDLILERALGRPGGPQCHVPTSAS